MNKFKLTLVAVSCAAFLTACSSSSGGADSSEQIRRTETTLTQKLVELNQQVKTAQSQVESAQAQYNEAQKRSEASQAEVVKLNREVANLKKAQAELALAQAEKSQNSAQDIQKLKADLEQANKALENANKASAELKAAETKAEAERKATEERLKQLENLNADEKARIPVNDQIFGGRTGVMTDLISGVVVDNVALNNRTIGRPLSHDISILSVVDGNTIINIPRIIRTAGELDPWTYEAYEDPYNLRKDGQTIQSNSNLKSTAFGVYVDNYTGKQYLYVQGNPTDVKQIPMSGKVEYVGGAVYLKDGFNNERSGMKATADFDTKTVAITINPNRAAVPEMNFGGKITGNSFAGEVNGVKTQGGFFGENAKELSGIFTNEADKSRGVFGAIKQEAAQ